MFWYNGSLVDCPTVQFDLRDRGLTLGDGIFDTALARNGRVFLRDAHLERLAKAAKTLEIRIRRPILAKAMDELAGAIGNGFVRLTLTRGTGARGLRLPELARPVLFGMAGPDRRELAFLPVTLAISDIQRNATSPLSRIKSLNYLDNILAVEAAAKAGADEALLLNADGMAACTATGNIFAIFGDRLKTPPLKSGTVPGIIRGWILDNATAMGLSARQSPLDLADLYDADGVFMTNSLRLIAPVTKINGEGKSNLHGRETMQELQGLLHQAMIADCGAFEGG